MGGLDGDAADDDDKSRVLDGVDVCELVVPVGGGVGRFVVGCSPPPLSLTAYHTQNTERKFIGSANTCLIH